MSLLIIAGPAGVGKGTIVREILSRSDSYTLSVSATTRAPRPGEIDGVHYHFISKAAFEKLIQGQELIEWAVVHSSDYYGTPKSELERAAKAGKHLILEIDVQGAVQVMEQFPEAIDVFIEPPSFTVLIERLRGRGTETEEQVERRLVTAEIELREASKFRHRIVNDNLDECVAKVIDLVSATEGIK